MQELLVTKKEVEVESCHLPAAFHSFSLLPRLPIQSGFNVFLRHLYVCSNKRHSTAVGVVDELSAVFPCELPFLESDLFLPPYATSPSFSRRQRRRLLDEVWRKKYVNEFFGYYSWLEAGAPKHADFGMVERVLRPRSTLQWQYAERLLCELRDMRLSARSIGAAELSIGHGGLEKLMSTLGPVDAYAPRPVDPCRGRGLPPDTCLAKSVVAHRQALPERAGRTSPLDYLSPERAAVFRDLSCLLLPEEERGPVPRPCHLISVREENKLISRMLTCGMVTPVPTTEAPRDSDGSSVSLRAVTKTSLSSIVVL